MTTETETERNHLGQTYEEARAYFVRESGWPSVHPERVPALVALGLDVMSFGYGDGWMDPDGYTALGQSDLDVWYDDPGQAVADWGPFGLWEDKPGELRAALAPLVDLADLIDSAALAARWAAIDWDGLPWRDASSAGWGEGVTRADLPDDLWDCPSCSPDSGWTKHAIAERAADGTITVDVECGHCGWQRTLDQQGEPLAD